jgi:hypothetical protein
MPIFDSSVEPDDRHDEIVIGHIQDNTSETEKPELEPAK